MRKLILLAIVLAPLGAACHQNTGVLDAIKPGTPVVIKTSAGQTIGGALKESRSDALVVQPASGPAVTVPRSQITSLTVSTPNPEAQPIGQPTPQIAAPSGEPSSGSQPASGPAAAEGRSAKAGGAGGPQSPAGPPQPQWREVTIPAGTPLSIQLDEGVASDRSHPEEPVRATLLNDLVVGGVTAARAGSLVGGNVTSVKRSGKVKGVAELAIRFDSIRPKGSDESYRVRTGLVARKARTTRRKDALEIGAPAAGGAILGGLLGGKKGALIGTTVGGGAGTAVVLNQRGEEVRLPTGTRLHIKLLEPVTVRVPA